LLAQAVLASYERPESDGVHWGQLTVTGISPCPYATYLNYHRLDEQKFDPASILRMKNGRWQEAEVIEDLRHAGFKLSYTGAYQMTVHVGKVPITGRPDGLIVVDSREDVLSVKARDLRGYTAFKYKGIKAEPMTECQEQMYLASEEFRNKMAGTWVYVKHKDSCGTYDFFIEKDLNYSKPIIESVEEIVIGRVEVKRPDTCPLLSCRHRIYCFKEELLDISGIKTITKPELVQMWMMGQFHLHTGNQLNEEARALLKGYLGDGDVLYVEDQTILIEAKRIVQHRTEFDRSAFVDKYGAAALTSVLKENIVEQMRVTRKD